MNPHLYALVLGATIAHLREQKNLQQTDLADRLAFTKSKMSRIELGRSPVDMILLQKLCAVLGIERERLLVLVDEGMSRARDVARQILKVGSKDWWTAAQGRVGPTGTAALVTLAVSDVLAQQGSA